MQSDVVYVNPVGGDHVRRPAISLSDRRRSAPPRPPRPELNPWPKGTFQTSVLEVSDDVGIAHLPHADLDGCVEIRPQDYGPDLRQHYPGRISPVSEEETSSAGSNSSNVSPSNSLNKKSDERPALRRRPFSFESMRSAASCYSQDRIKSPHPESLTMAASEFEDYADIAQSNPYEFQREIDEMRPYASHTYSAESEAEEEEAETAVFECGVKTASTVSLARPHSFIVPMSRYNSQDSQQQRATEPEKTLDEAWMGIRKAIAPKLQIGIPTRPRSDEFASTENDADPAAAAKQRPFSTIIATKHALPPNPPPPPVPTRNPRRLTVGVGRHATVTSTNRSSRSPRLSQSTSSPNISESYQKRQLVEDIPPVPEAPMQAHVHHVPAQNMPLHVPAPLPTPETSDCSADSRMSSLPSPISSSMRCASTHAPCHYRRYSSSQHSLVSVSPSLLTPPLRVSTSSRTSMGQNSSSEVFDDNSPPARVLARGFREPPPVAPPRSQTVRKPPGHLLLHKKTTSDPQHRVPLSPGIWTGKKAQGATFTTQIWAGPSSNTKESILGTTLRAILPGESATRSSYSPPPNRSQTTSTVNSADNVNNTTTTPVPKKRRDSGIETDPFSSSHLQAQRSTSLRALPSPPSTPPTAAAAPQTAEKPIDPFAPLYIIPLNPKFKVTSTDEYLPKFSNSFAGFCKCAWRHQTAQGNKAFTLRTVSRTTALPNATSITTKATTLKCKKCSFEGPLSAHPSAALSGSGSYAGGADLSSYADKKPYTAHGVVYRWSFLFKSHVPNKAVLRKDENLDPHADGNGDGESGTVFACVFCCVEGKGTVCFEGAKRLCGHIAKCHPKGVMNGAGERELRMRVGIVVGRRPDRGESWDVILPGNRERNERTVKNWL